MKMTLAATTYETVVGWIGIWLLSAFAVVMVLAGLMVAVKRMEMGRKLVALAACVVCGLTASLLPAVALMNEHDEFSPNTFGISAIVMGCILGVAWHIYLYVNGDYSFLDPIANDSGDPVTVKEPVVNEAKAERPKSRKGKTKKRRKYLEASAESAQHPKITADPPFDIRAPRSHVECMKYHCDDCDRGFDVPEFENEGVGICPHCKKWMVLYDEKERKSAAWHKANGWWLSPLLIGGFLLVLSIINGIIKANR